MNTTPRLTVAYSRVSSVTQNLDRQTYGLESLRSFERTYEDKVSGTVPFSERPAGRRLVNDVEKGMIGEVYVWEVSRIGRDLPDIHRTLQFFVERNVQVVIHKEGIKLLNDDGSVNATAQLVLSVMAALAQIERQNIRERMLQGVHLARLQGKYIGRRSGTKESAERFLKKPKSVRIVALLEEGYGVTHIAKILGVSTTTIGKVKRLKTEVGKAA